jgi:hypothetical protein
MTSKKRPRPYHTTTIINTNSNLIDEDAKSSSESVTKKIKLFDRNDDQHIPILVHDKERMSQWKLWRDEYQRIVQTETLLILDLVNIIIHGYLGIPQLKVSLPLRPVRYFISDGVESQQTCLTVSWRDIINSDTKSSQQLKKAGEPEQTFFNVRPIQILGWRKQNDIVQWLCAAVRVETSDADEPVALTGHIPQFMHALGSSIIRDSKRGVKDDSIPQISYDEEIQHSVQLMVLSVDFGDMTAFNFEQCYHDICLVNLQFSLFSSTVSTSIADPSLQFDFDWDRFNHDIFQIPIRSIDIYSNDSADQRPTFFESNIDVDVARVMFPCNAKYSNEWMTEVNSWKTRQWTATATQQKILQAAQVPGCKLWIHGPSGSGKSTVAHTIGAYFSKRNRLHGNFTENFVDGFELSPTRTHFDFQFLLRHSDNLSATYAIFFNMPSMDYFQDNQEFVNCLCGFSTEKQLYILGSRRPGNPNPICILRSHLSVVVCSSDPPPPFAPDLQVQVFHLDRVFD